jgi:dihydroflavonol-4-reductase
VGNLSGKKIAVTGATGFLGRYVVTALQKRGAIPIGVVRNPDRVPELRAAGVELRRADLGDLEALKESFAGCDAIASVAAMINIGSMYSIRKKQRAAYIQTNVGGIERVMEAAHACGIRRIVHVSSANVYRDRKAPLREDSPLHDLEEIGLLKNNYSISKAAAEQRARAMAAQLDLSLTILRPTGIYGANDLNFMRWVSLLLRPPITLWPAGTHLQLVHGTDVAEALMLSLENDRAIGEAYNVCGGSESLWEFAQAWARAGGPRSRLLIPIPVPVPPLLENGKIREELGWSPRDTVTCLRETFATTADPK